MDAGPAEVEPTSHHAMTQTNVIGTNEGTNGTMRKAKELSLELETAEVNSHPTLAVDYKLSETVFKGEDVYGAGVIPRVDFAQEYRSMVKRGSSSTSSGDRPVTKSDMKELIVEFRKEVDLTMKENVDNIMCREQFCEEIFVWITAGQGGSIKSAGWKNGPLSPNSS